mmetsp:Transcript_18432/g.30000  ORF Transcript_18432/g.30000 Transcript_18432/m.30000 type:complete len:403 (-) Transcript_18432:1196-2404(-)
MVGLADVDIDCKSQREASEGLLSVARAPFIYGKDNPLGPLLGKLNQSVKYEDERNQNSCSAFGGNNALFDMPRLTAPKPSSNENQNAQNRLAGEVKSRKRVNGQNPRRWTKEEDDKLRDAVCLLGDKRWKDIAAIVKTRDNVQCLQRWRKSLRPGLIKGPWRQSEDDLLRQKHAEKQNNPTLTWSWVASHIDGRNAKQCRERWRNFLDDSIKRGGWSEEEDQLLQKLFKQLDGRWAMIARKMPGRTENSVKVRYQSMERLKEKRKANPACKAVKPVSTPPTSKINDLDLGKPKTLQKRRYESAPVESNDTKRLKVGGSMLPKPEENNTTPICMTRSFSCPDLSPYVSMLNPPTNPKNQTKTNHVFQQPTSATPPPHDPMLYQILQTHALFLQHNLLLVSSDS